MKSTPPARPARDLPVRIPGSAKPIGSGSAPDRKNTESDDAEFSTPEAIDRTPRAEVTVPRLSRFSSLGSREEAVRTPAPSPAQAGADAASSAETIAAEVFGNLHDVAGPSDMGIAAPQRLDDRTSSRSTRRAGSRGALAVVGIVGLLAVGGAVLTLGAAGGQHGDHRDGSRGYGTAGVDGPDVFVAPSVNAPAGTTGAKGAARPTAGSPKSSAANTGSAAPAAHSTAVASAASSRPATNPQVSAPGVNVFSHASHRCIDVVGGRAAQGARLMIWDCKDAPSQHWEFTNGSMRALGMCVQLAGGSTDEGTDLVLSRCDGSPAQQFSLNPRHDLVSLLADKCADVRDDGRANGTRIQLWSCAGTDNQKWTAA
ncbi:ricin-type beta-trefoil lectin domain protein [Streptomyces sp. NPDC007856]|uniref:ricin-type beta-trefoil lectin domain protein n=1 Tax=Streptomyces sp. NPDC007856 TaxID=3364781 RepID=UPI00368D8C25